MITLKRPPLNEYNVGNTEEISASDIIFLNMLEYSKYIVASKYPHCVDGLKLGQRRVLWLIKNFEDPIAENMFIGMVNEYHHHGDGSIATTVARMKQTTEYGYSLIETEGNSGGYGTDVGAARYVKVGVSQFTRDVFFDESCHLKTIPMMDKEDYSGTEPMYLIPRLPTSLLFPQLTIGIGYKTMTPVLKLENVCDLVQKFAEYKQALYDNRDTISPSPVDYTGMEYCFLPEFPVYGYLRNSEELLKKFANKDFKVSYQVEGMIDVSPSRIMLRSIPYGQPIQKVTTFYKRKGSNDTDGIIKAAFKDKSHWLHGAGASFVDMSSDDTIAAFATNFKRGHHPMSYLDRFKKMVGLQGRYTPIPNYSTQEFTLKMFDPIELISTWYTDRYNSIVGGIKYRQMDHIRHLSEYEALLIVTDRDCSDKAIEILRSGLGQDDIELELAKTFNISRAQARYLTRAEIRHISPHMRESTIKNIESTKRLAQENTDKLDKAHEIIHNDALYLAKKYRRPRRTKIEPFIGYIRLGGTSGIIQFESMDELIALMKDFDSEVTEIINYRSTTSKKRLVVGGRFSKDKSSISKQVIGDSIVELYPEMDSTVRINKDGTCSSVEGLHILDNLDVPPEDTTVIHTTRRFLSLNKYGHFKRMSIRDLSLRKTLNATGAKYDVIGVIPLLQGLKEVFVIHSNDLHRNTLTISRVTTRKSEPIQLVAGGNTTVLGVYSSDTTDPRICAVPDHFKNMSGFIMFENLKELMFDENSKNIEMSNRYTRHKSMKQVFLVK